MIILLSKIPDKHNMDIESIVNYCIDNGISEISNDYGYGISVGLNELDRVWETNCIRLGWRDLK